MNQTRKKHIEDNANKSYRLEIIETKPSGFYIQDLEGFVSKEVTIEDFEFRVNILTSTEKDNKLIKIKIELNSFIVEKKGQLPEKNVFGITSTTVFRSPDIDKILDKNQKIIAPDEFMIKLFNICIGGIRGMLSVKLSNTELQHITLPLLDFSNLKKKSRHPHSL